MFEDCGKMTRASKRPLLDSFTTTTVCDTTHQMILFYIQSRSIGSKAHNHLSTVYSYLLHLLLEI